MSSFLLNSTTPAAPADAVNVKFQGDALSPIHVSAYVKKANTVTHGLVPPLPNDADQFFNGVGAYARPKLDILRGINAQVGNAYTVLANDLAKLLTLNNANSVTLNVPVPAGAIAAGFWLFIQNLGAGIATLVAANGTLVDGQQTLALATGQGTMLACDGANWFTMRGLSGSSITLQTNGVNNGTQTKLNLKGGANISIVDSGNGDVTIDTGSGGNAVPYYYPRIVQSAFARGKGATATLPQAPTSGRGNILVFLFFGATTNFGFGPPAGLNLLSQNNGGYSTYQSWNVYWRLVQPGDGAAWAFTSGDVMNLAVFELSGAHSLVIDNSQVNDQNSTTLTGCNLTVDKPYLHFQAHEIDGGALYVSNSQPTCWSVVRDFSRWGDGMNHVGVLLKCYTNDMGWGQNIVNTTWTSASGHSIGFCLKIW